MVWRHRTVPVQRSFAQNRLVAPCLTLALALLQFVQALGVTESGTFRFLPVEPLEVPGRDCPNGTTSEHVGSFVVDEVDWTSCIDWFEPEEVSVPVVSDRFISAHRSLIRLVAAVFTSWRVNSVLRYAIE